ncbi:MAG: hypothetical protein K0R54_998 [Clostridiaceae bacterium]|jgi:curli biogenesis system outer membrane secretion channel CsgG|nr:hypothetical protein [Clostridiaceae bacterium]
MKKVTVLLIAFVLLAAIINAGYTRSKSKEITYAVEHNLTTGLFNRHKLYSVSNFNLAFSDSSISIMQVEGIEKKVPHDRVYYDVLLEKHSNGIWKVKKVYLIKQLPAPK